MIHITKECPECARRFNHPTDDALRRDDLKVKVEVTDEPCGRCDDKGVENRDTPL